MAQSEQIHIPGPLAQKILDLQFEAQSKHLNEASLGQLLSCYSEACYHYYEQKSQRFTYYQDKIKKIFKNPHVMHLLGEREVPKKPPMPRNSYRVISKIERAKVEANHEAKVMMERSQRSAEKTSEKIDCQLTRQRQNILERVKARSVSKKNGSLASIPRPGSHKHILETLKLKMPNAT